MTTVLCALTMRNLKVFLRDKANVFFSLLSPLIVLGLYVLFIGRMQSDGIAGCMCSLSGGCSRTASRRRSRSSG